MKPSLLIAFFTVLTCVAVAEDTEVGLKDVRILGAEVAARWGAHQLLVSGGWNLTSVGRDLETGRPLAVDESSTGLAIPDARVLTRSTWPLGEVDLWAGAGLWGQGHFGLGSTGSGVFSDRAGGLMGLGQVGLSWNKRISNARGVRSGPVVDAVVEVGPRFLSVRGTDYLRAELRTSTLLTLWDLEGGVHLFSGTLGLRANASWLDGSALPLLVLQPTEVRGYRQAFESRLRTVASAELRVGLPSVLGASDLVPMVFGFVEGGGWAGYANAPASHSDHRGWLASAGTGFGLTVFGYVTPTFTLALPLVAEADLWWAANFDLRF